MGGGGVSGWVGEWVSNSLLGLQRTCLDSPKVI